MKKFKSILVSITMFTALSSAYAGDPYDAWCPKPSAISVQGTIFPMLYEWSASAWNYAAAGVGGSQVGVLTSSEAMTPIGILLCVYNSSRHFVPQDTSFDIHQISPNLRPYIAKLNDPMQGFLILEGFVPAEK